jgi:hypothetical protein
MKKIINQNKKFKTIELKYTKKPTKAILNLLHKSAFKWAPTKGHWYAKNTDKNKAFAKSLGKAAQTKLAL